MTDEPFRIGTRGSDLARRQAEGIAARLEDHRLEVELVEVSTRGDRIRDELVHRLGRTGAFVRALDERVLDGDLDAAVHSMKDMPTEMPGELIVAAVPRRAPAEDVLVTPDGDTLEELPDGATVGTGSLRRRAQLRAAREDLEIIPVRGNVDTRLEKLLAPHLQEAAADPEDDREAWRADLSPLARDALDRDVETTFDAMVLATAGLERAGLLDAVGTVTLPRERFVPAPGQGALAVTMRDGPPAERIHRWLDEPPARVATTVERTILSQLGGGCIAPIGVHGVVQGDVVATRVQVLSSEGEETIEASRELPLASHPGAAREFADELAEAGAADIIAAATDDD